MLLDKLNCCRLLHLSLKSQKNGKGEHIYLNAKSRNLLAEKCKRFTVNILFDKLKGYVEELSNFAFCCFVKTRLKFCS